MFANLQLYVALMGGVVISIFLIVGELVFLRTKVKAVRLRWKELSRQGRRIRLALEVMGVSGIFLVQPFITGYVIVRTLDQFTPGFSRDVVDEFHQNMNKTL
ncbi:hypothetical protein [Ferrovum sp.]|uniref:hypothetical protein n=1 Tax=Ferrovum sp. TaxID=2609467 RepID=UPI00262B7357|nr:hypothetical protein [Ferrovum sp.]